MLLTDRVAFVTAAASGIGAAGARALAREEGIFVGIWVPSILSAGALLLARNSHE